jgi:rare lipoprotein A
MNCRKIFTAWLLVLPLFGWQNSDRPSPFPEKRPRSSAVKPAPDKTQPPGARASTSSVEMTKDHGLACYYTPRANEDLVGGHASYPLGSWVKVTNVGNGKSVEVKITERFPASSGRVINLSESAARKLDFLKAGTAEVQLALVPQRTPMVDGKVESKSH